MTTEDSDLLQEKILLYSNAFRQKEEARESVRITEDNLDQLLLRMQENATKFGITITPSDTPVPFSREQAFDMINKVFEHNQHSLSLKDSRIRLEQKLTEVNMLALEVIEILNRLNLPVDLTKEGE